MCFLCFNKYKVNKACSSVKWSSVKWTVLGKPRPKLNKIIFSTKPSGPVWATLSQILIFVIIITLIVSWYLKNGCYKNLVYFSLF